MVCHGLRYRNLQCAWQKMDQTAKSIPKYQENYCCAWTQKLRDLLEKEPPLEQKSYNRDHSTQNSRPILFPFNKLLQAGVNVSFLAAAIAEIQNTLSAAFVFFMATESFFTIFPVAGSLALGELVRATCHQCAIKAADWTFRMAIHHLPAKVNLTIRTFGIKHSLF